MIDRKIVYNKNILIAVDESKNSHRAVSYVSQLLAGIKGLKETRLFAFRFPVGCLCTAASGTDAHTSRNLTTVPYTHAQCHAGTAGWAGRIVRDAAPLTNAICLRSQSGRYAEQYRLKIWRLVG